MNKKGKLKRAIDRISEKFDLPVEFLTGSPRIEILGNHKLLIENHKGILEYGSEIMKINCGEVIVKIEGKNLNLCTLGISELSIDGIILSIEYVD